MKMRLSNAVVGVIAALALSSCNGGVTPSGNGKVRTPTFQYGKDTGSGCADVYLFKGTADSREVLLVGADKEKLNLPEKGGVSFDLAAAPAGLYVKVDLWNVA